MKKLICCAVFCGVLTTGLAFDGNGFVEACQTVRQIEEGSKPLGDYTFADGLLGGGCMGYLRGFLDNTEFFLVFMNLIEGFKRPYCLPDGVTIEQLVKVGLTYFEDNPAKLQSTASDSLILAFGAAFPCEPE